MDGLLKSDSIFLQIKIMSLLAWAYSWIYVYFSSRATEQLWTNWNRSFAYYDMILNVDSGRRSKIYIMHRNVPRPDPCTMFLVIDNLIDCLSLIATDWTLSLKKYIIQFIMDGGIFNCFFFPIA